MSLAEELEQKRSIFNKVLAFPWWKTAKGFSGFVVLSILFSQCVSLSALTESVKTRPILQVGKNAVMLESEELPEEENRRLFIQESAELMLTSSPWVPKELDPKCAEDPNCQQAEAPMATAFGHKLPSSQAYASYLATAEYQEPFIKSAIANQPEDFSQGFSKIYRVGLVGEARPLPNRPGVYQSVVRGSSIIYNPRQEPVKAYRDNRLITFQETAKPTGKAKNLLQQEAMNIRSRGYEISLIQPIVKEGEQ